jgi:uncharacterized protein (DUF1330 family)
MKAYIVSFIDVHDEVLYQKYVERAPQTIVRYGGQYVARNGTKHAIEGELPNNRVVLMEFPSVEKAKEWYHSAEYQEVVKIRHSASSGKIFIIEGPTQPVI